MGKVYAQAPATVLDFSGALAGSDDGIGASTSGSMLCNGYSRLTGLLTLAASLQSASGFGVFQSADQGISWDLVSAQKTLAAGTSPFSYEIYGDAVKVFISNGSSANTVRTLWRALPFQTSDIPAGKVSASISGGSVANLAGENHVGEVGGKTVIVTACFVRPANTTQYAIGDMWSSASETVGNTLIRLPNCARKDGGSGLIDRVVVIDSASQATMPQFNLFIFDNTITSPSDNAPFPMTDAEAEKVIGVIPVTSWYPGGSTLNAVSVVSNLTIPFVCQSTCNSLWGVPVLTNAYTPVSAENLTVRLGILDD